MFKILTIFFLTISLCFAQQICLSQECPTQVSACDTPCQTILARCTFECTLGSQGCMQDCSISNQKAASLLQCSYDKCLNFWWK